MTASSAQIDVHLFIFICCNIHVYPVYITFFFILSSLHVSSLHMFVYMLILIFFNKRAETVVSERDPPKGGSARQAGAGLQLTITLDTVYLARRISVKIYNGRQ